VTEPAPKGVPPVLPACLIAAALAWPRGAAADAGPPFLTNDPGTPGHAHWEINVGAVPTIQPGVESWQLPQLDVNFGLGQRIQLTYEVPYVVQTSDGSRQGGWGNAVTGVKWRFFDAGEGGWQLSTFPQLEMAGSTQAQREGIAIDGPRLLVPLEVAKTAGPYTFNFEAGYWFSHRASEERILGFVAGRSVTPKLELDAELYNDHVIGAPQVTTLDVGGRFKLHRGFVLLFMAGRSLSGNSSGQVEFMGYLGIQILLSHYGRSLTEEP
jgi:hypothetical protein